MPGAMVPAPVVVHFKFGGEVSHASVTVPSPATVKAVCASILAARDDVRKMLSDQYVGFELALCDGDSGRPMAPDAPNIEPESKVEVVLTKEYAVRAFAPVRKYVVGRFLGTKPPKFKAGRAAAVDWSMRASAPELQGQHGLLHLVAGGKIQAKKENFQGTCETGALGNFYLLMMQANTTDVCAIPMEGWYNFRPDAPRQVLTLEEAEEALERRAHNQTATTNFMERHGKQQGGDLGLEDTNGLSDDDDDLNANKYSDDDLDEDDPVEAVRRRKLKEKRAAIKREKNLDANSKFGDAVDESAPGARGMRKQDGDDWEHDGGASDDELAGEADELQQEEPPPPPVGVHDSDDERDGDIDEDGNRLDASGKALNKLLGKQEEELNDGGISDDSDDDDEFVDPDQEELHPFLLQQRDKMKAIEAAEAAVETTVITTKAPVSTGVKRSRSDDDIVDKSPVGRSAKSAKAVKNEPVSILQSSAGTSTMRPIESALREILKKGGKPTTKDVTKQLRKKGLLNTDSDKTELKETIGRIARIRKEGNTAVVVLQ